MAVTVVEDTIDGASLTITAGSLSITRRFVVAGITPDTAANQYEVILNAELDIVTPAIGEEYPTDGVSPIDPVLSISCVSKTVTPHATSKGIWFVVCRYEARDATTLPAIQQNTSPSLALGQAYAKKTMSSSLTTVQTNRLFGAQTNDAATTFAGTTETISLFKQNEATKSDNKPPQSALVDVQQPTVVLRFQRHEIVDTTSGTANHVHVGKTNSATFAGYADGKLLLTNVSYEPVAIRATDDEYTYIATYEFQVRTLAGNWRTELAYTDENRLPFAGATFATPDNKTLIKYLTYEEHDFTAWNLEA